MEDAQVQKEWGRLAQLISATISVSDLLSVHIHLGLFSVIIELSTLLFVFFFVALGFSLLPFFFSPLSSRFLPLFHVAVQVICLFCLALVVGTLVMFFCRAGWLRHCLADLTAILALLAKKGWSSSASPWETILFTVHHHLIYPLLLAPAWAQMSCHRAGPGREMPSSPLAPALPPPPPRPRLLREA